MMTVLGLASLLLDVAPAAPRSASGSAPGPATVSCSSIRTPEGALIVIDRIAVIYFRSGSARIDRRGRAMLDEFAGRYDAPPHCQVFIAAHSDTVGGAGANLALSARRAEAVRAYLRSRGLAAPVTVEHFGETRPVLAVGDGVAEPENRRVEIYVGEPGRH
jgi:outer membrane protein OmpA-like peptidoglycan-associated protein